MIDWWSIIAPWGTLSQQPQFLLAGLVVNCGQPRFYSFVGRNYSPSWNFTLRRVQMSQRISVRPDDEPCYWFISKNFCVGRRRDWRIINFSELPGCRHLSKHVGHFFMKTSNSRQALMLPVGGFSCTLRRWNSCCCVPRKYRSRHYVILEQISEDFGLRAFLIATTRWSGAHKL